MTFASLGYCCCYLSGFQIQEIPTTITYAITVILAILGGFSSSFLWATVGTYIHKVAHLFDRRELKGKYFGIFNFLHSLSLIFGGLIVTFVLPCVDHSTYFLVISFICFTAFLYGAFFIEDLHKIPGES